MDPWLIRMVNHPKRRDPGELYLSHCTATHSTEQEWWTKTSTEWSSMTHRLKSIMHWGQKCILMGHPRTRAQISLPFIAASSPHYGNSFYRSRPRKASVLACWTLFACLPVLTSSHFSQLLHLWFTAALCQSPLLPQSAAQSFGSVSHGSTLITELQLLSQNGFPVATPKVYKLLL